MLVMARLCLAITENLGLAAGVGNPNEP